MSTLIKAIKYILATIAILSIAFLSLGFIYPEVSFENKVLVNKPIEHSFLVFNNPNKLKDWVTGFKKISHVSGFPNEVGSKWALTIEEHGEEITMIEEITAYELDKLFAFKLENDVLTTYVEIRFEQIGSSTTIVVNNRIIGKNIFFKSLFPLFKSYFAEKTQADYEKLKNVIESTEEKQGNLLMRWLMGS
ncbi:MAG: hypothetical protein COB85_06010 [Bacteroidetes bacterium]|nr:MAG: hypothetical protein COB85_06010 [Bacteroidota bacterium]